MGLLALVASSGQKFQRSHPLALFQGRTSCRSFRFRCAQKMALLLLVPQESFGVRPPNHRKLVPVSI